MQARAPACPPHPPLLSTEHFADPSSCVSLQSTALPASRANPSLLFANPSLLLARSFSSIFARPLTSFSHGHVWPCQARPRHASPCKSLGASLSHHLKSLIREFSAYVEDNRSNRTGPYTPPTRSQAWWLRKIGQREIFLNHVVIKTSPIFGRDRGKMPSDVATFTQFVQFNYIYSHTRWRRMTLNRNKPPLNFRCQRHTRKYMISH